MPALNLRNPQEQYYQPFIAEVSPGHTERRVCVVCQEDADSAAGAGQLPGVCRAGVQHLRHLPARREVQRGGETRGEGGESQLVCPK